MTPEDYNRRAMDEGLLTPEHVVTLVRAFQDTHGLQVDGKAGVLTRRTLDHVPGRPNNMYVFGHVLHGPRVELIRAHSSWHSGPMSRGPLAIVAHYTATDPGTARSLHTRRVGKRAWLARNTSWHLTIAADGAVYQMVPLAHRARHCGRGQIEGRSPNEVSIGIELEGHGATFPEAQVTAACRVWRALVEHYGIPRDLAMVQHSTLDPQHRSDPGPVWMREHVPRVLAHAFEVRP